MFSQVSYKLVKRQIPWGHMQSKLHSYSFYWITAEEPGGQRSSVVL